LRTGPKWFALGEFIEEVAAEWRPAVEANGNRLAVDCTADCGSAVTDAPKLRQALVNLLSNAAKFTKQGEVSLSVGNGDGRLTIAVRDTGAGIEPERIASLCETFGSGESDTASKYGECTGLGLPLARRLCRLLGGDLVARISTTGGLYADRRCAPRRYASR
jgi:signal transduction histidine kinase